MARTLRGRSHGKLGLHRVGGNVYTRKGVRYKRTRHGFQQIGGGKPRKAPYDPLQPLAGKDFDREIGAAANLKYGGQERQLGSESRISGAQQQRIGDWYNQYLNTLGAAQRQTQAGYQQAQQGVYTQANQAAGQDEQNRQRLAQEAQQSAGIRGTSASAQPEAQQAAQATRALSSSFGGMIGAQGAAAGQYAGALRTAGAQAKVGAHQDEAKRQRQIMQLARDLAAEKGQFKVQYRGDLRDKERTYALNRQAFGLDVAKAQEQTRHNVGMEKNVRRGQNLVARSKSLDRKLRARLKKIDSAIAKGNLSERKRHNLAIERESIAKRLSKGTGGGGGGSGRGSGLTPTQSRNYQDSLNKSYTLSGAYIANGQFKKGYSFNRIHRALVAKGIPSLIAEVGILRAMGRKIGRKQARRLYKRYGVHVRHI